MTDTFRPALHFVGFWDQDIQSLSTFHNAVKVFGQPDFVHRHWDHRAWGDVAPGDKVVFGSDREWNRFQINRPAAHAFNDSEFF